jgi:hypothetical protein
MSTQIQIEIQGKKYRGHMEVLRDVVTVSTSYGTKSTHIGASPAEVAARMLLRELVQAEKQRTASTP